MKLSRVVNRYFEAWISQNTWNSSHWLDNERFYRFVKAIIRYSRRKPTENDIRYKIMEIYKGKLDEEFLYEEAERFTYKYSIILAYERTKDFPNPIIEKNNIFSYYFHLRPHYHNNTKELERIMAEVWGKEWKKKLEEKKKGIM